MDQVNNLLDYSALRRALPLGVAFLTLYHLLKPRQTSNWSSPPSIPSPTARIISLPQSSQDALPYPPNALPGARDVPSPFGTIRIYEWGPPDGPRVLLIHGISTPCISLASVAKLLVSHGYRVMLFDLFGRGYSDTPDPVSQPQNMQLFTTQILLALTSSPVAWTGERKFRIVGYSLGGGIAVDFTSYFPALVEGLVLIAPSGLLRKERIHWSSRMIYGGPMPRSLVYWLVGRRLGGGAPPTGSRSVSKGNPEATPADVVVAEVPGGEEEEKEEKKNSEHPALMPDSEAGLYEDRPGISVADAVRWQLGHHRGFLPAFVSSIQHAPISEQQGQWKLVGDQSKSLRGGKVLMVLGADDGVIVKHEIEEDARAVLGDDALTVRLVDAGHDLPIVKPKEVVQHILDSWQD
ncbi:Serine hydrolase-like protein [Sphaceloma murrayae]|uniref:Serine hydrolase-like protein n=1 Tax=Sphaceloma murrayae TaxID=2082308 RepID=A0A2K1QH61_9PEZI|nr:Serine hydrolase-like protein [Sphaceloma murrayae]